MLILRAEHDGIATDDDMMGFCAALPTADKLTIKIGLATPRRWASTGSASGIRSTPS